MEESKQQSTHTLDGITYYLPVGGIKPSRPTEEEALRRVLVQQGFLQFLQGLYYDPLRVPNNGKLRIHPALGLGDTLPIVEWILERLDEFGMMMAFIPGMNDFRVTRNPHHIAAELNRKTRRQVTPGDVVKAQRAIKQRAAA